MTISSNKYANKVYSEHPIALWPLDEQVYYLSLVDNNDRDFANWTDGGLSAWTVTSPTLPTVIPFSSSPCSSVIKSSNLAGTIDLQSPNIFTSSDIYSLDQTFTINTFFFQYSAYVNWYKVGFRTTLAGSPYEEFSDEIPGPTSSGWVNLNETFSLPTSYSGSVKIFIQINFKESPALDPITRVVVMNGLSIGQDSSLTCYETLGNTAVTLPSELSESEPLNGNTVKGIPADQYGPLSENAYYIVKDNKILAHNDGMSMIYGTDVCTRIESSNSATPSFVFPGKGMLHEKGKHRDFTLEMWMKIDPQTSTTHRIIGPLDSIDGIYVKEGFITLVINNEISSHYVGQWYRPMLIHLILKESNAVLLINGEEVINIPFNKNSTSFSTGRDWWGVYSKSSFIFFAIDCISIYPYVISEIVAKRRFVYGQGTPNMQIVDSAYSGTSTSIDFATSQYGTGIMYPDTHRWDAGYFNNLNATKNYLSVPNYSLPIINIGGNDLQQWYEDNYMIYNTYEYPSGGHPYFITFRPNLGYKGVEYGFDDSTITMDQSAIKFDGVDETTEYGWAPTNEVNYADPSYLNFPSLTILNDRVVALYAIFEAEDIIESSRTLVQFSNVIDGSYFDIRIQSNILGNYTKVYYSLNGNVIYSETIGLGLEFAVGLNFDNISSEFGYEVAKFFSAPSSIQVFIGGNGVDTFEGKIYNVSLCNQNSYDDISTNFYEKGSGKGGIINSSYANYQILTDNIASYSLLPEYDYGTLFLDISVSSQWEEFYPLSYFAGYIKDANGNNFYDIDMLQLNLDYSVIENTSVWSYQGLQTDFSLGTYNSLKSTNSVYSTYFNLKKKNTTQTNIVTSSSALQGYITFQNISDGANASLSSFPYEKIVDPSYIIYADKENTTLISDKAYKTKFSFVDNMLIYPPKSKDFNDYAMVVHLQIKQRAILKNPLKIKKLEICAKNFNYESSTVDQRTTIGTKFGNDIYPLSDSIFINTDKPKVPYFISKQTLPYLFNAKNSGIKIIEESNSIASSTTETKIKIPINKGKSPSYKVSAFQFMIKPNFDQDVEQSKVIDINYNGGSFSLVLNKTSIVNQTVESYTTVGNGVIIDGGSPSTATFLNIFDGGEPDSIYTAFIDFSSGVGVVNSVVPYSYSAPLPASFYQNGKYVKQPVFRNNEWTTIGILFNNAIDFGDYSEGNITLYGGAVFNNISYYQSDGLGIRTEGVPQIWNQIQDEIVVDATPWSYWNGYYWQKVLSPNQSSSYLVTPKNIYQTYVGTNGEIIDDGYGVALYQGKAKIISNGSWSLISGKPV